MTARWIAAALLALSCASPVFSQDGDTTLQQALEAYRAAQEAPSAAERPAAFARAERLFAAAAASGSAGPELWTNLGTAALQAEHLGTAILAYRRALALDPDNRHAMQNLLHARSLLPPSVPRPESGTFFDSLLAWQHSMSAGERRGGAALAFFVAAALLGGALATGSGALRILSGLAMVVWGLLIASDTFAQSERSGVLTAPDTVARAADSRNAPARFPEPLPAGTEVTIAEVRGEWAHIVLANGRDAWVSASAVDPVDPDAARQ